MCVSLAQRQTSQTYVTTGTWARIDHEQDYTAVEVEDAGCVGGRVAGWPATSAATGSHPWRQRVGPPGIRGRAEGGARKPDFCGGNSEPGERISEAATAPGIRRS